MYVLGTFSGNNRDFEPTVHSSIGADDMFLVSLASMGGDVQAVRTVGAPCVAIVPTTMDILGGELMIGGHVDGDIVLDEGPIDCMGAQIGCAFVARVARPMP